MQTLIEKLNTPFAVVAVLAVILIANGFLIYQVRSSPDESTGEQAARQSEQAAPTSEPDDSQDSGSAVQNDAENEEEESPTTDETTVEEIAEEETSVQEAPEETQPEDTGEEEQQVQEEQEETEETVQEATPTLLAGLSSSVGSCREAAEDDEECIRDFVTEVAPDSRYVGGRIDLAAEAEAINTEIIYFEDPGLAPCEFERAEYDGESNRYAVILVGEGSFSDARGDQCIPQA